MLRYALDHPIGDMLFFYFSSVDQDSHVFWGSHERELIETYRRIDGAIGEAMRREPGAALIVMSDHGFAPFQRSFNLNTWLKDNGFLALDNPWATGADELFPHVDWRRTKAYSLGLNALYLNLAGREKHGVVQPGAEANQVLARIARELLKARDPASGASIVASVDRPRASLSTVAPDLIIGYRAGFRASWGGALGAVEARALENNDGAPDRRSLHGSGGSARGLVFEPAKRRFGSAAQGSDCHDPALVWRRGATGDAWPGFILSRMSKARISVRKELAQKAARIADKAIRN